MRSYLARHRHGWGRRIWEAWLGPMVLGAAVCVGAADKGPDPALTIPFCTTPPAIDGKLKPGEWDFAAGIGMLESYYQPVRRTMREEQVRFYVCWDKRRANLAGAPAWVLLGNGGARGEKPFFRNIVPQHFAPKRTRLVTFFTDLVVGSE